MKIDNYDNESLSDGVYMLHGITAGKEEYVYQLDSGESTCSELIIPSFFNKKPITMIAGHIGMRPNVFLRTAYIPEYVKCISENAFCLCCCLEKISIPDSFIDVDSTWVCFGYDYKLQEIDVRFGSSDGWLGTVLGVFSAI